ncbi:MAG: DNA polymerase I, partial [Alphaproteobacteria bacterium]|nr:DNA polymerase I [Alphaproteobacteria bacterium]
GGNIKYAAVIFDAARKTFRNDIYPEYKAHRPPAPDDLIPQFALVREATRALGLPAIELLDYEADDIIATYAARAREQGITVTIVSSDKDLMQLIGDGVELYDAMKNKPIGAAEVMEKFGVAPEKVLDVLSLMGDSSDNVPGVPGIGPKTAAELIGQFGDLETLLERAGEIKQNKRRESLIEFADQARLSKRLIALDCNVPLPMNLEEMTLRDPDPVVLGPFLVARGFKSLAAKFAAKDSGFRIQDSGSVAASPESRAPNPESSYSIVRDEETLAKWIARARKMGRVAFDTETTSLDALRAELVGFSMSVEVGEACYVPLQHRMTDNGLRMASPDAEPDLFSSSSVICPLLSGQIPLPRALALLKPLLEDESVLKIGHNIKYDLLVMHGQGANITPVDDTMLLSYCLHAGEHGQGMDELAERYLGHKNISFDEVTGTGKNRLRFDEVEIEKAGAYAAEDADITLRLHEFFKPQLPASKVTSLYETIERPLIPVLVRMEEAGIKVNLAQLSALSVDFAARMGEYEQEIYALAGRTFNVGSPKQLGEILFDELSLPGGKKSAKTGAYSTGNDVLEDLAEQGHTLPEKIILWRQLAKLKSTYSDALVNQINPKTKRVHTSYAMAIASTGRLSSTDPNLQNIPIRTIEGKKIREAFIAEDGFKLLSADYSQIELRLLAHVADIEVLKTAFRNGDDIHAITASQMFGVPVSDIGADLRRSAKTINFGIIYGISAHGLAARLGIGRGEAAAYIDQYFKQYPGIRDYMETTKEFAREHGYVTTLFGRRVHVPGITDKNGARRQFSERAAINAPLQGTAADIIKKAMISVDKKLVGNADARMLLQVHDELVLEVRENAVEATSALVKNLMENAAQLSVPLTVETGSGNNWGEAH